MLCFPDTMESSASLGAWFEREKISVAHLTPQTTQLLTDGSEKKLPALRRAFFGGDILTRSVLARFQALAPSAECVNFYGATETPQAMGFHPVLKNLSGPERLPVGRGIAEVQLLFVNRAGQRAGVGEPGKIVIFARRTSRGATSMILRSRRNTSPPTRSPATPPTGRSNCAAFASSRAKSNPRWPGIPACKARRCCLTGKTRRVVCGAARPDTDRGRIARLRGDAAPAVHGARFLRRHRRAAAHPQRKTRHPRAAQQLDGTAAASGAVVRPWTPLQVQILRLWEELLSGRAIGMRDNFFELGGHSLLAVRLLDRIEQECGRKLPLALFFAAATAEQLADHLAREEMGDARPLLEIKTGGSRPPFLFWHGDLGGGGFYTQKISRHLGPDQPFHVLPPCRLEGDVVPDLEAMAAEHLRVIRAHTPPD